VHVTLISTCSLLVGILLLAYVFAKVEVHIEGTDGWASKLPTWRIERHWLLDLFFGGRPMTGYHAWMLTFMGLMFHFPALATWSWSWHLEARMVGAMVAFWILEDFLWFVINPAWGWRRFNAGSIPWHKRWLAGLPLDYWFFAIVAGVLLYVARVP